MARADADGRRGRPARERSTPERPVGLPTPPRPDRYPGPASARRGHRAPRGQRRTARRGRSRRPRRRDATPQPAGSRRRGHLEPTTRPPHHRDARRPTRGPASRSHREETIMNDRPDDLDLHLFGEGTNRYLHRSFGAQPGDGGTRFAVWAPNATAVAVTGSFDDWSHHELSGSDSGVWSGWVEGAGVGARYLYRVTDQHGRTVEKSDPVGAAAEEAPGISSIIADLDHAWGDDEWM